MNPSTNCPHCGAPMAFRNDHGSAYLCRSTIWTGDDGDPIRTDLCREREENQKLRELLEKVLFELEKVPFQNPKLTAFTAHRLADRYREKLTQLTK